MTSDTIAALAGRDLDAAVAVALGWKRGNRDRGQHEWLMPTADKRYASGYEETPVLPEYSSPGAAVFLVLARLRELGWYVKLLQSRHANLPCECFIAKNERNFMEQYAAGDTLPIACCRALLLCVESGT